MSMFHSTARRASVRCWIACLFVGAVVACADGSSPETPAINPLPVLTRVTPALVVAGSGATTLTVTGSGFVNGSQVRWNDGDRVTHYRNGSTLAFELLDADVAALTTGEVTVVNGAPGGGTSGSFSVAVGYPAPKVTSVTPNAVPMPTSQLASISITITGTGFVNQSMVRVGSNPVYISSVTSTRIVASMSFFGVMTPGTLPLTVTNPAPGGGASNSVDFDINYPVPAIASLTPDSSFTGGAFTLTVNGSNFGAASVVRWNGSDRPTTYVSATKLTAAIPATDVAAPSSPNIVVFNPTPGGGTSNVVTYKIREAAPSITGVNPGVIVVGAGTTTIAISGANFRSGASAQWNGSNRPSSLVSGTSMTVTLSAADLAAPRTGLLTVTNPGGSGVSNAMAVAVIPSTTTLAIARTITLASADVVYDNARGVLYASVPSNAKSNQNSVVRLDPTTGAVTGTVGVGSNPNVLAITDDGQYLYVGLLGAPSITRVSLATFTKDIDIPVPGDNLFGNAYAEDIVPIPGAPRTIAVSTFYTSVIPRNAGAFVFDDAVRRPAGGPGHTGSNRIVRGPTAGRIYGYNNETTEFGFRSVIVATDGLHEDVIKGGLISSFGADIVYSGGFVYATTGEVIDVAAMQKVGTIPASGIVQPDATNGRVHFLAGGTIRTYHYRNFVPIGEFSDPSLANHTRLVRWGNDGLAIGGGASLVLLRGSLVGQ